MAEPVLSIAEQLRLLVKEGKRHVVAVAAVFSLISVGALAVGVFLPKEYEAHAILLAESKNMIDPLMAGRAVPTTGSDGAQLVRQAFLSRRILREVLAAGGWALSSDPIQEVRTLDRLARRITIQSPRRELIRISYRDSDPRRCLVVTNKLAEIYIRESTTGKEEESRDAFVFIEKQVREYAAKVEGEHAKVLRYTRDRATSEGAEARRAPAPRRAAPRMSPEQLAALSVEESTLTAELAGIEAHHGSQRRAERTAQLERDLESLLTSFTENHPSVKRARAELQLQREDAARAAAGQDEATRGLRVRLERVRREIAAGSASPEATRAAEATEAAPEMRGVGQDSVLSELVRRYEATREMYQDLLRRRENARVSMELETERGSGTVRVYEAPELPVVGTGLRLMHVALIGLALGVLAPVGLLLALLRLDPRVRSAEQLERVRGVPLLVGIPYSPTVSDRRRQRLRAVVAAALVACVVATYVGFFIVKVRMAS